MILVYLPDGSIAAWQRNACSVARATTAHLYQRRAAITAPVQPVEEISVPCGGEWLTADDRVLEITSLIIHGG
jgi:hypothetical protein